MSVSPSSKPHRINISTFSHSFVRIDKSSQSQSQYKNIFFCNNGSTICYIYTYIHEGLKELSISITFSNKPEVGICSLLSLQPEKGVITQTCAQDWLGLGLGDLSSGIGTPLTSVY